MGRSLGPRGGSLSEQVVRRLQGGGACARVRSMLSLVILLALAPVLVSVLTGCELELGLLLVLVL